jgi:cytochrome b pre-mRNA-processing protein 3
MLSFIRRNDPLKEAGRALFAAAAGQARRPEFYLRLGVPDTIDGRFDLLALHGYLILEALKERGDEGHAIGTHFATFVFESLDEALRELGAGDIGVSRRIKAMADAFYGRLAAYGGAKDEGDLVEAILRNLFRGDGAKRAEAVQVAAYARKSREVLLNAGLSQLYGGAVPFAPLLPLEGPN